MGVLLGAALGGGVLVGGAPWGPQWSWRVWVGVGCEDVAGGVRCVLAFSSDRSALCAVTAVSWGVGGGRRGSRRMCREGVCGVRGGVEYQRMSSRRGRRLRR